MSNPIVQYTTAGLAELISARKQGIQGKIKWCAAGDHSYSPSASQTQLQNERQRELISDWESLSPTQLRMGIAFKGDLEYEVREIGFFLDSGTLLAVYSVPNTLLAYKSSNASWLQKFTLDIAPLPTNSITVEVGTENINLMMTDELATMAAAQVDNMARHVELLFRVTALEQGE